MIHLVSIKNIVYHQKTIETQTRIFWDRMIPRTKSEFAMHCGIENGGQFIVNKTMWYGGV
jgi:hypothetical protein